MCLAEGTGTLNHVETILILVCGRAPELHLAGHNDVRIDRIRRHTIPSRRVTTPRPRSVPVLSQGPLTPRQPHWPSIPANGRTFRPAS